jgi:DNA-binding HxlR family transcriptional regulator
VAGKRSYGDPCGIARALDVVGERWALLVVRELVLGPKRFTDLKAHLPGIATDVLSQRLRQLEQAGILRATALPHPASGQAYELTERGHELEPVLHALGRWGSRESLDGARHEMTVDAFVVALSTVYDPTAAGDRDATVVLDLEGDRVVAVVRDGRLEISRGEADQPDARIESSIGALREVLWRGRPLAEAERDGTLVVHGLRSVVRRFLTFFPPVPARTSN